MRQQLIRRLTYGSNVVFAIGLAFALIVMLNWLAQRYPWRHDFIQAQDIYRLSGKTQSLLASLENDVHFYVFGNPQDSELYPKLERLLREYDAASRFVSFTMVDPVRDIAQVRELARRYNVAEPDTVVITYGDRSRMLTEMRLADFRFSRNPHTGGQIKTLTEFKAEQAFTSALIELIDPTPLLARFTINHGERSISSFDNRGMMDARRMLESDNIIAKPIDLITIAEIPSHTCDVLVVAGPSRPFMQEEINVIRRYLNNGGRALFLLDPEITTGLEPLLREYNIDVTDTLVFDPRMQAPGASPLQLIIGLYAPHPITRTLQQVTIFLIARAVQVLDETNDINRGTDLAITTYDGWADTDTGATSWRFDPDKDIEGPVSIAVAIENIRSGMRIVAVGDSDFASNGEIELGANRDFFMNAINWLIDREELVEVAPRSIAEQRRLNLSSHQQLILTILVIGVVPILTILAGIGVYYLRRRY